MKDCKTCKNYDTTECEDCVTVTGGVPTNYKSIWGHAPEHDPVNRPVHYTHGQFECIDVMVDIFGKEVVQHFCLLNAFKYVWRTNYKNGIEDIKKAMRYLEMYLELEGKRDV